MSQTLHRACQLRLNWIGNSIPSHYLGNFTSHSSNFFNFICFCFFFFFFLSRFHRLSSINFLGQKISNHIWLLIIVGFKLKVIGWPVSDAMSTCIQSKNSPRKKKFNRDISMKCAKGWNNPSLFYSELCSRRSSSCIMKSCIMNKYQVLGIDPPFRLKEEIGDGKDW